MTSGTQTRAYAATVSMSNAILPPTVVFPAAFGGADCDCGEPLEVEAPVCEPEVVLPPVGEAELPPSDVLAALSVKAEAMLA